MFINVAKPSTVVTFALPQISVYTPSHDPKFLNDAYDSLKNQTYLDWEWIVLLNNGSPDWEPSEVDSRVKVHRVDKVNGVGEAKKICCDFAQGEILVELDHDDILSHDALKLILETFEHTDAVFVYSDFAQINEDGTRNNNEFSFQFGWEYSEDIVNGMEVKRCHSMSMFAPAVSYIWFAPNHIRAFRKEAYIAVGGYNSELEILDDLDLICKLYQYGKFVHINECLYLQRVHPGNTQAKPELNQRIQVETVLLYDKYVEANAKAWAKMNNLLALDLGAAHNKPDGYVGIDIHDAEWVGDVYDILAGLEDNSVGVIRSVDFLEHLPEKIKIFNEFHRVLAHGGMLLTLTPSTDGRGAFQDPTHISYYNSNSFWYYTKEQFAKFVPEITCRFQVSRLDNIFMSEFNKMHNIVHVLANLVAIKDGPRIPGELNWS